MARCSACAAPLPTQSHHCRYCGVRNDMDLHALQIEPLADTGVALRCPECEVALNRLSVAIGQGIEIGHCASCYGMFFSPGGVEHALSEGVSNADRLKIRQIDQVNRDRFNSKAVRYRFCPACLLPMRRFNFAARSGVIIDQCTNHGIWLDNGELIHLLEWKKSGGHLLDKGLVSRNLDPNIAAERIEAQSRADKILKPYQNKRNSVLETDLDDLLHSAVDRLIDFLK